VEDRNAYLDLREFVLHVVRVHRLDLFTRRGTEHLDDFDELVDSARRGMTATISIPVPEYRQANASGKERTQTLPGTGADRA
jgi:hypothetical protein